jgi:galactokinase
MIDARRNESCEFPLDEQLQAQLGHWSNYPQTVARRFARNFPQASHGAAIAFASNLPVAAGMSSSSALIVGTFLALAAVNDVCRQEPYVRCIRNRDELAGYLAAVENGTSFGPLSGDQGVGTSGGSEDHTAILNCQSDRLSLYAFCPVRYRRSIAVADQYVFEIASSGVISEKTGNALAKYNRLPLLAAEIVREWRRATNRFESSLMEILESAPDAEQRLRRILSDTSHTSFAPHERSERLEHLIFENRLIDSIPQRIDTDTIGEFGELAAQSQAAATRLLKNQTLETTRLVELAARLGAYGASSFGAGFGGSVWAIVDVSDGGNFVSAWQAQYEKEFPQAARQAEFFLMRPGLPAITWGD